MTLFRRTDWERALDALVSELRETPDCNQADHEAFGSCSECAHDLQIDQAP